MGQPNLLQLTIAQITNASTTSGAMPTVTNNGLPFGDNQALSPAVAITGDVAGFGNFSSLTLAYFGLNQSTSPNIWTTGSQWAAVVSSATNTYTGSIPVASDQFAAVVMQTTFWNSFLSQNPSGQVTALPSPQTNPNDVLFSIPCLPGQGRSITWDVQPYPRTLTKGQTNFGIALGPGLVFPAVGTYPLVFGVKYNDPWTHGYTVNSQPVQPTDAAFITGLLVNQGCIYAPTPTQQTALNPYPQQSCLMTLTLQAVGLGQAAGGYLCIFLYQNNAGSLYLLTAIAGPNTAVITSGVELFPGNILEGASVKLTGIINIFSDQVTFNIVGDDTTVQLSGLADFLKAFVKLSVKIVKAMFAAI